MKIGFDEIRWGTSLNAVAIPEPGTVGLLLGLVAPGWIGLVKRRRS